MPRPRSRETPPTRSFAREQRRASATGATRAHRAAPSSRRRRWGRPPPRGRPCRQRRTPRRFATHPAPRDPRSVQAGVTPPAAEAVLWVEHVQAAGETHLGQDSLGRHEHLNVRWRIIRNEPLGGEFVARAVISAILHRAGRAPQRRPRVRAPILRMSKTLNLAPHDVDRSSASTLARATSRSGSAQTGLLRRLERLRAWRSGSEASARRSGQVAEVAAVNLRGNH